MRSLTRILACALALAALAFAGPALAQGRPEIFAVSGVRADVTAASAAAARPLAFAQAQRAAFSALVRRLAAPDQGGAIATLAPTDLDLARLQAGIDVEDERIARTRYIGRFTVNFDPAAVRAYLAQAGVDIVEVRAPAVLIVAQAPGGAPGLADQWRQAWIEGGFARELAPIAVAPAGISGLPAWEPAAAAAAAAGAATAVYASVRAGPGDVVADLTEVGPGGFVRARGEVRAGAGEAGLAPALRDLAGRANALLQDDWKRSLDVGAGAVTRVAGQALYQNQAEWLRIKRGLAAAAATLVSGVRIEAVNPGVALVSFGYVGAPEQLAVALAAAGVEVSFAPSGAATLRARPG